jgi:hypothetical protein
VIDHPISMTTAEFRRFSRELTLRAWADTGLPAGAMRVAPGTDALVWRTTPAKDEPRIVDGDSPDWHAKGL